VVNDRRKKATTETGVFTDVALRDISNQDTNAEFYLKLTDQSGEVSVDVVVWCGNERMW
jgi:hypothetical protein